MFPMDSGFFCHPCNKLLTCWHSVCNGWHDSCHLACLLPPSPLVNLLNLTDRNVRQVFRCFKQNASVFEVKRLSVLPETLRRFFRRTNSFQIFPFFVWSCQFINFVPSVIAETMGWQKKERLQHSCNPLRANSQVVNTPVARVAAVLEISTQYIASPAGIQWYGWIGSQCFPQSADVVL